MAMMIIGMVVRPNMEIIQDIEELKEETKALVEQFLGKKLTEQDIPMEVQPIAFGLKQVQATFMAPGDAETSKVEDMFANSPKVESMTINRFELTRG